MKDNESLRVRHAALVEALRASKNYIAWLSSQHESPPAVLTVEVIETLNDALGTPGEIEPTAQ